MSIQNLIEQLETEGRKTGIPIKVEGHQFFVREITPNILHKCQVKSRERAIIERERGDFYGLEGMETSRGDWDLWLKENGENARECGVDNTPKDKAQEAYQKRIVSVYGQLTSLAQFWIGTENLAVDMNFDNYDKIANHFLLMFKRNIDSINAQIENYKKENGIEDQEEEVKKKKEKAATKNPT